MAATICWIGFAAGLFSARYGAPPQRQAVAVAGGGLVLTAAAMAKLFLFDLGTLDGIFRVVAFIVVGLVLLAMGAGYARSLAATDDRSDSQCRRKSGVPISTSRRASRLELSTRPVSSWASRWLGMPRFSALAADQVPGAHDALALDVDVAALLEHERGP